MAKPLNLEAFVWASGAFCQLNRIPHDAALPIKQFPPPYDMVNLQQALAGATANWQHTDARLTTHLQAGSDSAAIGGDLAYQYGKNSNLTGMGLMNAQSVIAAASFGQTAQTLNNPTVWQAEVVKLA